MLEIVMMLGIEAAPAGRNDPRLSRKQPRNERKKADRAKWRYGSSHQGRDFWEQPLALASARAKALAAQ